ncbi:hypothetical protein L2E82_12544 [Cichorium intybus]|uniref:Uncharacterized protein n=1 Tax=Cichorium intybus TaxID=13427 RepID=A0ACB9GH07_CICIN|nr:hypothetical protein L2E82_12544 [Cichorium intybus]
MMCTRCSNPRKLDVKKSDTEGIKRAPTSKPPFTLADIKKAIPPHCFERFLIRSFSHLIYDITAVGIFYYLATIYIPQLPRPLPYLAWPHDEVHVPKTKSKLWSSVVYLNNPIGRTLTILVKLTLGWYFYLSINAAGRPYDKFASHYDPRSPIFSEKERGLILISDIGLLSFCYLLYTVVRIHGFAYVFCIYGGALMVMNAFLVTITYLHHTHPSLPHYNDCEWSWMKGAFATVDRDYGVLNKVFHNITDTHVLHHLFAHIPHYHAMEATKAIRPIVGDFYQIDSTPFFVALWRESKNCLFIEPDESNEKSRGIYWFRSQY